jgi:hypothetical protein
MLASAVFGAFFVPVESRAQGLRRRVAELERRLAELAGRSGPLAVTVDCAAGQTVTAVLARTADHTGPLTVTIRGRCTESVTLARNNVTLQGSADGDGLVAPDGAFVALSLRGARGVVLRRLTLDGNPSATGLLVDGASALGADDLAVHGAVTGIVVLEGGRGSFGRARIEDNSGHGIQADGSVRFFDSRIAGNEGTGLLVHGRAEVSGTVVEANRSGVDVVGAGVLQLNGGGVTSNTGFGVRAWRGSTALLVGTSISGNGSDGLAAVVGSSVEVGATIEDNGRNGIYVADGSVVRVADNSISTGPTTIRNNRRDGIFVDDTSTVEWPRVDVSVTGNGGWGVFCADPPAVAMVQGGFSAATVAGNAAGQLHCPGLMLP